NNGILSSEADTAIFAIVPCFNLSARPKPGEVQLTWTHQDGTERYDIYRAHESNPFSFTKIGETTSTYSTYLDTTVVNEATYLYVVGAFSQGMSCFSNVISAYPTTSRTRINYAPVIYSSPITHGTTGIVYNYDVQATDPNGDALSYSLSVHPSGMGIDPITGLISWIPPEAGSFTVTVNVSDGKGGTDNQSFTLMIESLAVSNNPPVADAGPDQTVLVGDTVTLDGSGSTDLDGDPLTYNWSLVSVPTGSLVILDDPTTVHPTFVVDLPGAYVVQLIVHDGKVDSAVDIVIIAMINSAPVANAGPDQTVFVTDTVQLDGSGSSDVDGDPLTFNWSLLSIPAGSLVTLSNPVDVQPFFVVDKPGTYVVQLIVNDGKVDGAPDTVIITTENSPPIANAGPDQTVFVGDTVTLDGNASQDVDGD
ncbi:MAG: PKD domain-containing protein, partial [Nitrospira sp.]|nr:PKD domain-containing protein [Nitrospira sp.]